MHKYSLSLSVPFTFPFLDTHKRRCWFFPHLTFLTNLRCANPDFHPPIVSARSSPTPWTHSSDAGFAPPSFSAPNVPLLRHVDRGPDGDAEVRRDFPRRGRCSPVPPSGRGGRRGGGWTRRASTSPGRCSSVWMLKQRLDIVKKRFSSFLSFTCGAVIMWIQFAADTDWKVQTITLIWTRCYWFSIGGLRPPFGSPKFCFVWLARLYFLCYVG